MRTLSLLAVALAFIGSLPGGASLQAAARTRVYLTFASHNDYSLSNLPCRPVIQSRDRYLANRAALVSIAELIASRGGTYDFQTDWEYMTRVSEWDDQAVKQSTDGLNVIAWLARFAPGRVAVHAHSHENVGYNYADVAYLVEQMTGLASTNVVGGYIASPVNVGQLGAVPPTDAGRAVSAVRVAAGHPVGRRLRSPSQRSERVRRVASAQPRRLLQ